MRVLFWVPYPTEGASNRYRIGQYLPYLENNDIRYSLHPFWRSSVFNVLYKNGFHFKKFLFFVLGTFSRIFDILLMDRYDIVFIHREAFPIGGAFFETIVKFLNKPIIFDFDDAIFLPSISRPNSFIERFKNFNKVRQIIKKSNHVIVGNDYLRDFTMRYNNSVTVIPTVIDINKYQPGYKNDIDKNRDKIIIGWIGSPTTLDFLASMRNVFIVVSNKFTNVGFKIVGGYFNINNLPNLTSKPWKIEEELEDLRSFDIGIMPMPNNEWTKGKCAFKAILYMSMAIPCVCSAVGVNRQIIIDGENGFLADKEDEWIEKLFRLIKDAQLRKKIGEAGRKTVEVKYSLKVNAPKFLQILEKIYYESKDVN